MPADKQTLDQLKIHRPAASERGSWRGAVISIIFVLLLLGGGAWWWFGREPVVPVRTAEARVVAGNSPTTLLNASGYVTARRQATVSSKVTGMVVEVLVEEGMQVKKDQVLARLDSSNVGNSLELVRAQLAASKSALGETEASLDLARRELERTRMLATAKGASASEVDRSVAQVSTLEARLVRQRAEIAVAERQVASWQQQFEDTVIRAPFSGIVVSKNAQPGEMISPMSAGGGFTRTGICTVVDMDSLEIEVDVNESYINRVSEDQPVAVTLDSYPDWTIPARVIAIIPTADRQKATVRVRVGFDQLDPRILPDMGLKVAFQAANAGAAAADGPAPRHVVVARPAVRRVDGRDVVWIVRNDRLERRAVSVASSSGSEITLSAGLSGGESIVIEGPADLAEGGRVKVQQQKQ